MTPAKTQTGRMRRHVSYSAVHDLLVKPEYTGENRCLPCTGVNLLLTGVLAAAVWTYSPPAGLVVGAVSIGLIALRGYFVPGTPTLTKRYLPDRVLALFDHGGPAGPTDGATAADVTATLRATGVVVDDPRTGDLALDRAFSARLADRVVAQPRGIETDQVAALLAVQPERVSVVNHGDALTARLDGRLAGQWESRVAFYTDIAASEELADRYGPWSSLSLATRSQVLGAVRLCLDRCPVCDGRVRLGRDVVESCCRTHAVVAATCEGCGARLSETRVDTDDSSE
jgi:hypothetical protein